LGAKTPSYRIASPVNFSTDAKKTVEEEK